MKKLFSAVAICGAMFLTACDSNADVVFTVTVNEIVKQ